MTQRTTALDQLDLALVGVRRVLQLPAYRRRLMAALDADVPLSTLRVIRAVERLDDDAPPSIGDVAELLGIAPSTASRAVDDAVARGFVARAACEDDRRRQQLRLTDHGRALLARATAARRDMLADVTGEWPAEALHELVARLQDLLVDFQRLEDGR